MAPSTTDDVPDPAPIPGSTRGPSRPSVAAIVPAKDEGDRIGRTLAALRRIEGVDLVVVVDDGSSDGTAAVAEGGRAVVVRHSRNRGKAAAMTSGARRAAALEFATGAPPRLLLFVDADLEASASELGDLIPPVREGRADMTIANLPAANSSKGRGRVVRLARAEILRATGTRIEQPLSGMRCLTREAFDAALPLAHGWGVEAAMVHDVLSAGYRVLEVPVPLTHRATGRDWRGVLHRGRQMRDVARALARRRARRVGSGVRSRLGAGVRGRLTRRTRSRAD